jgi:ubiquinone/menaquinone biosynthesis C-methylase UbiE
MATQDDTDLYLRSFQEAFRPELTAAVTALCPENARVLDCPCGDGFYAELLASHLKAGTLVAADSSIDCLTRARARLIESNRQSNVEFHEADAYALPFAPESFDVVWCAQSFITLADPVSALREMARVARPGARVMVLETDEYHHVLLPWPVELELAVFRAVRAESRVRYGSGGKFAQTRRLRAAFLEAGLTPTGRHTVVADRAAPFGPIEREFLTRHLGYLQSFVRPELTLREFDQLNRVVNPDDDDSLVNRPDGELTCLAAICHATK